MILDTSVLIAAVERRNRQAIRLIERLEQPTVRTMVVAAELEVGVLTAEPDVLAIRERSRDLYLEISRPDRMASGSASTLAGLFAEVTAIARASGIRIGQNDRWLLAEAIDQTDPPPIVSCDETLIALAKRLRRSSLSLQRTIGPPRLIAA